MTPSGATAALNLEHLHRLLHPGLVLIGWAALTLGALTLLWVVQRRAVNRTGDTLCGSCGYNVKGLTGHTCPECGGDLRCSEGILRPGWPYATETLARLVQWTILLPVSGLLVSGLAAMFLQLRAAERDLRLDLIRNEFAKANIRATGQSYLRPVRMDRVNVELSNYMGPQRVHVEVNARTLRYREPAVSRRWSNGEIDGRVAEQWLVRLGFDGGPVEGRAEAEELASLIRSAARDHDWHPAPARFRVRAKEASADMPRRDLRFRVAAAGFWAMVWFAGVTWIVKLRAGARRA